MYDEKLSKEKIKFESKEAEVIFDLSLEIDNLEQKNKQYKESFEAIVEELCLMSEELSNIKKLVKSLQKDNEIMQQQTNKAIEYLYKHSQYNDADGIHYINDDEYCVDYLLDILKGDSNK